MKASLEFIDLTKEVIHYTYEYDQDSKIIDLKQFLLDKKSFDGKNLEIKLKNDQNIALSDNTKINDIDDLKSLIFIACLTDEKEISAKKKYFTSLGLVKTSPFEIKKEKKSKISTDSDSKNHTYQTEAEMINEILIEACKKNDLMPAFEILKNYDSSIEINVLDPKSGWNCFHYCCYFGYEELLEELILKTKCDFNARTADGWTGLHFACFRGNLKIVRILENVKGIELNINIPNVGTPLHCACKKNHSQIVSLLMINNVDYRVKDSQGYFPHELSTDLGIKKLFDKYIAQENNLKMNKFKNLPDIPSKIRGYLTKKSRVFNMSRSRYVCVDPIGGVFCRYNNLLHYNNKKIPIESIPLVDIEYCRKIEGTKEHAFELKYKIKQVYIAENEELCTAWVNQINLCIISHKLWKDLIKKDSSYVDYYYNKKIDEEILEVKNSEKNDMSILAKPLVRQSSQGQFDIGAEIRDLFLKKKTAVQEDIKFTSFELLTTLGEGSFGKVFKVRHKLTGEFYAMKVINKPFLIQSKIQSYAIAENNVLKRANHPYIIQLNYSFQTPNNLYMVMEFCPGGDFEKQIKKGILDEKDAKFYIAELVLAIEYLHEIDVLYRDLKPENVLIAKDGHIRLADFGLVKENMKDKDLTGTFCGSKAYLAPEMISSKIVGKSADLYGIGTVLYEMLTGLPPFYTKNTKDLFLKINTSELKFPSYFTEECKSFLSAIMNKNPQKRLGVKNKQEIKNHPFFKGISWVDLEKKVAKPPLDFGANMNDSYEQEYIDFNDKDYSPGESNKSRFKNFSFVRENAKTNLF